MRSEFSQDPALSNFYRLAGSYWSWYARCNYLGSYSSALLEGSSLASFSDQIPLGLRSEAPKGLEDSFDLCLISDYPH